MASGSPCVRSRWDRSGSEVGSADAPQGGVQMAAAMAAKLNAMLMAKGKLKTLQPLPSKVPSVAAPAVSDEVVVAEVDINDVPIDCRNLLTHSRTQEEIGRLSGAVVSTKGLPMSCSVMQPLSLQVQGRCQEDVNKAVCRIKQIISEELLRSSGGRMPAAMPTVPVYRQPITAPAPAPPTTHRPAPPHPGSFVHTKMFVGLEAALASFGVRERVEGPSGSYLQHIQMESGARVFLRGRGSGYIEQASRRESFEPLYLYISHPNAAGLEVARTLCQNLLDTVRADHARIMSSAAAPVYPTHSYSAGSGYSSESWCSYPYPTYPTGYWSQGPSSQSQTSSAPSSQSQTSSGAVQYPVHKQSFLLQDEDRTNANSSPSDSPPRHHAEDELQKTQISTDAPLEAAAADDSRMLMPPPAEPIRKRQREETSSKVHTHTVEVEPMKRPKLPGGLVPYAGDSSDEEGSG